MCGWEVVVSRIFSVDCGVRQGGVLSPYLFALYVDSIIDRVIVLQQASLPVGVPKPEVHLSSWIKSFFGISG